MEKRDDNDKSEEENPKTRVSSADQEYRDYASVGPAEAARLFGSSSGCSSGGAVRQHNPQASGSQQQGFAVKLHYMLADIEASGDSSIVSWQPHGRCVLFGY